MQQIEAAHMAAIHFYITGTVRVLINKKEAMYVLPVTA
jgi:hypothetical protein